MPESFVTVGTYQRPIDAQLAKNRLEAEGIPVFLLGNEAMGTWFWHFGPAAGFSELQVREEFAERARSILAATGATDDTVVPPDQAFETDNVCPECGSWLEPGAAACSTCGMVREDPFERSEPAPAMPVAQGGAIAPQERFASPGDALATRAFRAAVIGLLLLPPLLTLYSFWLLLRLAFYRGPVSSAGTWKAMMALALDFAVFSVVFLFFRVIVGH